MWFAVFFFKVSYSFKVCFIALPIVNLHFLLVIAGGGGVEVGVEVVSHEGHQAVTEIQTENLGMDVQEAITDQKKVKVGKRVEILMKNMLMEKLQEEMRSHLF